MPVLSLLPRIKVFPKFLRGTATERGHVLKYEFYHVKTHSLHCATFLQLIFSQDSTKDLEVFLRDSMMEQFPCQRCSETQLLKSQGI